MSLPALLGLWMRETPVDSSVIALIAYDEDNAILEVRFRNGRTYRYFRVPPEEHEALLAAESVGRYFNEVIKPKYRVARSV
jgi:hypothetical protein